MRQPRVQGPLVQLVELDELHEVVEPGLALVEGVEGGRGARRGAREAVGEDLRVVGPAGGHVRDDEAADDAAVANQKRPEKKPKNIEM